MGKKKNEIFFVLKLDYHVNDFPKILMACTRTPIAFDLPQCKIQSI